MVAAKDFRSQARFLRIQAACPNAMLSSPGAVYGTTRFWTWLLKQGNESVLVLFDQLTISRHRVIPDIHGEMAHDFREIAKTLQAPRQKILPLGCLNWWISRGIKVDHGTLVAVIPIPEWNPGHQVLSERECKRGPSSNPEELWFPEKPAGYNLPTKQRRRRHPWRLFEDQSKRKWKNRQVPGPVVKLPDLEGLEKFRKSLLTPWRKSMLLLGS
jgi:hypothetical protein